MTFSAPSFFSSFADHREIIACHDGEAQGSRAIKRWANAEVPERLTEPEEEPRRWLGTPVWAPIHSLVDGEAGLIGAVGVHCVDFEVPVAG